MTQPGGSMSWRRRILPFAAVAALLLALWLWRHRSGVEVVVHNADPGIARAVEISTSAGVYVLGDLPSGASARTLVGARGESTVRVAWTRADGTRDLKDVGPYFEASPDGASAYGGEVRVTLAGGSATAESHVGVGIFPFSRGTAPAPDRPDPERSPR